ncbi:hypothetical protein ACUXOR_002438 [Staphylococcus pasteuri]
MGSSAFAMPPPTIIKSDFSAATVLIVSGLIPPATATFQFEITDLTVHKLSKGEAPLACKS